MRPISYAIVLAGIVGILAGCATRRQVQELKMQMDQISADQTAIREQNSRLDSLLQANSDDSRKLDADFAAYTDQLNNRMEMVEARLQDAITLMSRAATSLQSRGGRTIPQSIDTSGVDTSKTSQGVDCQKIYNGAYFDFVKERYDMAISGFKNYLSNCPGTPLADKAQYWIGECYYIQKNYESAQSALELMISKYPNSDRLAAAKLKLGESLYALRQRTKARSLFEDVIKNYPGTSEAQEAAQMLQRYR